ncbi:choice-of-anchor J domain-containing protein [Flavobacterium sp. XGLA_31]|uniref:choice-of-anchor J domain-containing protein n=1 Tax=Flavobacterium sp. XGLA_31 TaxID=3447666 RepID=UPI003F3BCBCF
MNQNQLFLETKTGNADGSFFQGRAVFNLSSVRLNFQAVILLLFLALANLSYGQLATEPFATSIPGTWAVKSNLVPANNWIWNSSAGYQPTGFTNTGCAAVNPALNSTVGTTAEYYLISPQFLTPANGEIRFFTKQGSFTNKGTTYQVRISTAAQPDITGFNVVLGTWTEPTLNVSATSYDATPKVVSLGSIAAGTPVYIAFVAITNQTGASSTAGDTWYVDDVKVASTCSPVTGITPSVSANSAVINWTHPTATNFGIEVVPTGAGHGATGTPVTGTTYTASNLTPNTTYDVYIITNCDSTTSSAWAGPFTFTTPQVGLTCPNAIIIPPDVTTTPYVLSSNLANYYTETDYTPYTTVGSNCFPASTYNQLNGNHLFFNYTPTTTGLINITQSVTNSSGGGGNGCYNASSSVMVFNSCADVGVNCLAATLTEAVGANYGTWVGQINDLYVQAGHTYVIVMSSPYQHATNSNAQLCFTFTVSGSSCPSPSPSGTTYNNLTQTSANFSWNNEGNLVSNWQYVVLPVTYGAPNGTETLLSTNTNLNNPVGGLSPATSYNLYVRSVCGGTPAAWAPAFTFRTPCNPYSLPYYTGFSSDDATINCWSQLNLNNDTNFFAFGNNAFSEPVAKLRTNAGNENDMLISPQFHMDGVTQKRLRFKYNIYGNWGLIVNNPTGGPGSFEVKLSTTGAGPNSFTTTVIPLTSYTTAYNFYEIIVPLPNITGDINIAWIVPPGATQTGNWIYIDDVYVEDLPACSEPAYPVVTPGSITSTSAQISWTAGYQNTQWQLVAQPLGTGTPVEPFAPGAVVNIVSTNPYTITGLNPSTRYEFYMRAYCSASEQSIWVGPIDFNTVCIEQPTPYYESFNDVDPNTKKFCWTTNNANGDPAQWRINATEATIYPQPITFFDPFVSYNDWLISVPVNAVGAKRLRFNYRVTAAPGPVALFPRGNFEVLLSSTPDFATYTTLIPLHDFTNSSFLEDSALFTGTGTTYIAFRMPANMPDPTNTGMVTIDDFVIEDAPACPNPSHLTVTTITTTTANAGWTIGSMETQWEIVVQEQGTGVPTGSGTTVNTTPVYNITGLTQDTAYEYYVRAVCNASESSEWVGPYLFRTPCNPLPTPFTETFDTTSNTESCWTVVNGNGDSNTWNLNQTVNPMFGNQMAALFTGSNGDNNDWLITPTLMAHAGQRLRFYYKAYDSFFEEDLKVILSTGGTAISQFPSSNIIYENNVVVPTDATGTVSGSNILTVTSGVNIKPGDRVDAAGWIIPYGSTVVSVVGNTVTLSAAATVTQAGPIDVTFTHEVINNTDTREKVINLTGITAPTNINIAFHTPYFPPNPWNYRGQYTFIDNVIVEDIPACPEVINVTTSNIVDVSAQINWQSTGSETSWEISVQPYGTPAPIGDTLPAYLHTATTHPYTVTGLAPATKYQYYVRAVCSGSSQSIWVGPFEFTTRCDYANVCQYTISTISGNTGQVSQSVNVIQNGVVLQELEFPGFNQTQLDYQVFLCSGVEFKLYWDGMGSGVQYSQAQIIVRDESNNIVWTSPLGLGTVNTNIYTGFASCGVITCPQPTNLAVNNQGVLSWTPGASETQWEVFIQPLDNGTLPQSGHIVNSPNYTPVAADFTDASAGTYEYFVRAICGPSNKSYWSGPKVFIRNDEPTTSVHLTPNTGTACEFSGVDATFIGATASSVPTSCTGVNGGDIWYDFVATSRVHNIELSDYAPGSYYASSYEGPWPKIIMSLYEVQPDGSLVEKACSENNSLTTTYASELVVGHSYKIRLKLNSTVPNSKTFHICITTPSDLCNLDSFNYDFEKLPMQSVTGVSTIIDATVVPGWRVNTDWGTMFYFEGNNIGVTPYSGGQCIQLTQDGASAWNPNDPNIKGLYKDFDTSEITMMDYSFASATRVSSGNGTTVQLFAGPPAGPFTVIAQDAANSVVWDLIEGSYPIPTGQTTTRFIFRVVGNAIGHLLDAANFKPNVDIKINSINTTLDCGTTSLVLDAEGVGQWTADASNPGVAVIATPNNKTTNVSGITTPGTYIFHWSTRYCDKTITITKVGTNDVPTVTTPVVYCVGATASPLTATAPSGDTLLWYAQATGGVGTTTAPTPTTAIAGNTSYFVAAVDGSGCEGARLEIVVTVNALPTATISGTTSICSGGTAVITFNGTPNATVTYTVDGGSNQTITLNSSGTATVTTPILTSNSTYALVSVTNGSCSQNQTGSAVITVGVLPTATISGTTTVCSGNTAVITFNGTPNATVTYTVNGGSNQTIVLNGSGTAAVTTPALTVASTYTLVSVSNGASCSQTQSGSAVVTVNALPTATISGTTTICSGSTAAITFTGTANATVTYTVDGGSNQTITLNGSGTATLTTPALTANSTYTLVNVTSAGAPACTQVQTGFATVTVTTLPTATISGTTSICSGNTATITFNGTPNATVTYTVDGGANQTITLNGSGTATVITPILTTNSTYNLVSVAVGASCSQAQSGSAVVTVNALPTVAISGTTTICSGNTTTITFTGTANATVTYTIDGGSNQTITLNGSGTAIVTTPTLITNSTYALVSISNGTCGQTQTGSAVVTVISLPIATISGTTSVCTGATAVITFNGTPNATVTYTVDGGSNQTITLNGSGTATVTTPVLTTDSTYTLVSVSAGTCSQTQTGSAVVTVGVLPTATISGTTTICSGSTATITFNGTPNATVTYTVDGGANQTITLNGSGTAILTTPALTANSTYALVSVANGASCSQAQTGSAVVTVNALPTAAISGTTTICSGTTATITFMGTANATVTYTVDGGSNQTITLNSSGTATITTPVLTTNSTYSLVSVTSAGTPVCSQVQTGTVVVTVTALPTATISGNTTICSGNTAVITFNGTPNAIVTYTVDGGANQNITLDGTGMAALTTPALTANSTYNLVSVTIGASCSQAQTGSVVITVTNLPTATISGSTTICAGNTATIAFNGTANATVTYTVNGGTNQTITLDGSGTASVTTPVLTTNSTYTLVSVASGTCTQMVSNAAIVTVNALPIVSISGTTAICTGNTTVITFTGTPNATVTYTVDGGTNQTIVLNGSGSATVVTPILTANSTYTLVSITNGTCGQNQAGSATITVGALPTATISGTATICSGTTTVITFNGTPNATVTYTVNGGANQTIILNSSGTATITTPALTADTVYALVSASTGVSCTQTQTGSAVVTVNALPTATISGTTTICPGSTSVITFNGTPNATVTYTVDGVTQTIVLDASGTASVTTPALAANSTYTLVSVTSAATPACTQNQIGSAVITLSIVNFTIDRVCQDHMLLLQVVPGNFNSTDATYTWSQGASTIGTNSATLNVDEYMAQNPALNLPLTFTASVSVDGCSYANQYVVDINPCRLIPRGISPNNDGLNDTFDLTDYGVTDLIIFNRYGTKVYSFNGNYADQWDGRSNNGDELPDGTYFYSIHTSAGATETGWVYINRQY